MANSLITTSWVIKEASMLLDNELIGKKLVYNDYSDEFVNGYGQTVTMKLPNSYEGRNTMTMAVRDTQTGSVPVSIDKVAGVDINFTDLERTFSLPRFSQEVIRPAMRTVANIIDRDIWAASKEAYNFTGTAGTAINGWEDVGRARQRLMEGAVPGPYVGVLSPADETGLLSSFTALTNTQPAARSALEDAKLTRVAGMDLYTTQNLPTITTGTRVNGAGLVTNGATQTTTWLTVKDLQYQDVIFDGFGALATVNAGEVFTLGTVAAGMLAVNPVPGVAGSSKPALPYLQQFTVLQNAQADGGGNITLRIWPALITSGANQTVSMTSANTDGLNAIFIGAASTTFTAPVAFHKEAIAFVNRPLTFLAGTESTAARETYKGLSMRVTPAPDYINSVSRWRFDVVYGVKAIRRDLMTRFAG
jgi:hypothetical protein